MGRLCPPRELGQRNRCAAGGSMLSSANETRGNVLSAIVGGPHRLDVSAIVVAALVTFHKCVEYPSYSGTARSRQSAEEHSSSADVPCSTREMLTAKHRCAPGEARVGLAVGGSETPWTWRNPSRRRGDSRRSSGELRVTFAKRWRGRAGLLEQIREERAVVHHRLPQFFRIDLSVATCLGQSPRGAIMLHDRCVIDGEIRDTLIEVVHWIAPRVHQLFDELIDRKSTRLNSSHLVI